MKMFGQGRLPLVLFPSKAEVLPEPLGLVLVFGTWTFPICKFNYMLIEIFHFLLFYLGQGVSDMVMIYICMYGLLLFFSSNVLVYKSSKTQHPSKIYLKN